MDWAKIRRLVIAVEDAIDQPPPRWDVEPMEVRDFRHMLHGIWSPLRSALLQAEQAENVGPGGEDQG